MKQFKPIVALIIILLLGVIIWTIYLESKQNTYMHPYSNKVKKSKMHQVAANTTKIPIIIGATVPHGNFGNDCLKCHSITGGDQKAAIKASAINFSAPMPHPFWGECKKCHTINKGTAATVAYLNNLSGKNIWGADVMTITWGLADQYNLPQKSGVLVNNVEMSSYAQQIGLKEGDIIQRINNNKIENIKDLSLNIANMKEGDRVRLQLIRNKRRSKNLKFAIKGTQARSALASKQDRIGVMASGPNLNSPVAYSLINSRYLIVYDLSSKAFHAIENPYQGMVGYKTANWLASKRLGHLIVGNINEAEVIALQQGGVEVYGGVFGNVTDSLALYEKHQLIAKKAQRVGMIQNKRVNVLAIPSNYPDPAANISRNFENSHYFIKVELDKNKYEVIANPNFNNVMNKPNNRAQGSGILATHFLVDNDVDALVVNQINSESLVELKKLNVVVYRNIDTTVGQAVLKFRNKKL